jgi:hypothetical protein
MGVCNAQLYGTIHGKTKDTFFSHPLIKQCCHRPNNGSQHHKVRIWNPQHLSYYCHDVSKRIWEGRQGREKQGSSYYGFSWFGIKLSPSTTTTHLWNSALKLEGVVGPMFEN